MVGRSEVLNLAGDTVSELENVFVLNLEGDGFPVAACKGDAHTAMALAGSNWADGEVSGSPCVAWGPEASPHAVSLRTYRPCSLIRISPFICRCSMTV